MVLKGTVEADAMNVNKFEFTVAGAAPVRFHQVSGLEEELGVVELPDRTQQTDGATKPGEFTAQLPAHHSTEYAFLEIWYREGQDPVSPIYKKPCVLTISSPTGKKSRQFIVNGCWIQKRKLPDLDMANDSDMASVEYTFKFDSILPIG